MKLPLINTNTPKKKLRVTVRYNEGGISYLTGNASRRGYYLHVTPVEIDGDFEIAKLYSGAKGLIEEATRFNARRLHELAEGAPTSQLYQHLVQHVLADAKLELELQPA